MQTGTYEFEVVKDGDFYVALPYDLEGGTQGESFDELCDMVSDWLKVTIEGYDMRGEHIPASTFGHEPEHGGKNVVFSVTAGRETVDKVSAARAAAMLGVTPGRVSQMIASGLLVGWRDGRNTYVTRASVLARKADAPRAGRPSKEAATA